MAAIYVGTYAKYNNGSIHGAWLNLEDYADSEEFLEACRELHSDEEDPELMFQDYEGFPARFYSECSIDPEIWNWIELDDEDQQHVENVWDNYDYNLPVLDAVDKARESFIGGYTSAEDFARYCVDEGWFGDIPDSLQNYIDFEAIARDLAMDYSFVDVGPNIYVYRFD